MNIAMTAYNRPAYLEPTLQSWRNVRGVNMGDIHLRCEPGFPGVVDLARRYGINPVVNPERFGVLSNVWWAIDDLFDRGADFVLVAEDDVVVADDLVEMMSWARDAYRNDPEVLLVTGASLWQVPGWPLPECSVFRTKRFSATSWGTWADRWDNVLRDGWDHDYSKNGWDWWVARDLMRNGPWQSIIPAHSRVQHIGRRGAHMTESEFPGSVSQSFRPHFDPGDWSEP